MRYSLSIYILCISNTFAQALTPHLEELSAEAATARYEFNPCSSAEALLQGIQQTNLQQTRQIDCLVLPAYAELPLLLDQLRQQSVFLPTVIVDIPASELKISLSQAASCYHPAVIVLPIDQLDQLKSVIDQAISKFIQLTPDRQLQPDASETQAALIHRLMAQQLRLAEKLKERLGYLGVYYKRNSQNFLRRLVPAQRDELLRQLKIDYREIILAYFLEEAGLNDKIDSFANTAFFADVPIAQIVGIHMELMDEFSKQLKLEGRSNEILLDYRLTLIDTLAHLCEMYRRSIPSDS